MFEHPDIEVYEFEEVPLNQDIFLVDEEWMKPYEAMLVEFLNEGRDYEQVGYVSYAAAREIHSENMTLSWYANIHTRFHEVSVSLPKSAFVTCVGARAWDEKPRIFVKNDWLEELYLRSYSVFAMIDAAGVKTALSNGQITKSKLVSLRTYVDKIAKDYPSISFISFADSLLLKSNWTVGHFQSDVEYTYQPEMFLEVFVEIRRAYQETLGLSVYGVFTQGSNEYYDEPLLHISKTQNHICLNSLGTPFAQLMAIENAARAYIRSGDHEPSELYMDELYYHSLRFEFSFDKWETRRVPYVFKGAVDELGYFISSADEIMQRLAVAPATS